MPHPDPGLKVLHVIPSLAIEHGGPTQALILIERALADQGIDVETIATDDAGRGQRNGKPCGVPVHENGVVRRYFRKRLEFYKVSPPLAWWILTHARHYDLVHIHALFSFSSLVAAWAARYRGVPYVLRPLGTLSHYGITQRRPWLKRASLALLEGPALRHAAAVHFTSEAEAVEAGELQAALRGVVIPLAVPPFPPSDRRLIDERFPALAGSRYVLYLSRLDPKKNIEGLLQALPLLGQDVAGIKLLVAGDGTPAYAAQLQACSRQLGLDQMVIWAGRLDGDLKNSALAGAELFVLPSFSENFGVAAAEALMAGLPCVLGQGVAISADIASAQAGLVAGTDAASIAASMRRIIESRELRATMAARAAALAQDRFSVHNLGASLKRLYTSILDR